MKRQTKIDMTILYYEEANTLDYKGRGKAWTWKDDDMDNFREGIEAATNATPCQRFRAIRVLAQTKQR